VAPPRFLSQATVAAAIDASGGWKSFQTLAGRRVLPSGGRRISPRGADLLWGLDPGGDPEWAAGIRQIAWSTLNPGDLWRESAGDSFGNGEPLGTLEALIRGLSAVALGRSLPLLALQSTPDQWIAHLAALGRWIDRVPDPLSSQPVQWHVHSGELALVLSLLFPELDHGGQLRDLAVRRLRAPLESGPILAAHGGQLDCRLAAILLASWTRAALADSSSFETTSDVFARLSDVLLAVLRLAPLDHGRAPKPLGFGWNVFFDSAVQLFGTARERRARTAMGMARPADHAARRLPPASLHDSGLRAAALASQWGPRAPRLRVDYSGDNVRLDAAWNRSLALSGAWTSQITFNQQPVRPAGVWSDVCWFTDEEVDYLEIEQPLSSGLTLQRHVVLAHADRFIILADAVLGSAPGHCSCTSRLPLIEGLTFREHDETWEGILEQGRNQCLVLPLSLPEWRRDRQCGALAVRDGHLEWSIGASGPSCFSCLFLDFDRRRRTRPYTWRRLTVAEDRLVVGPYRAAGFRVRIGSEQWLLYRSLEPGRPRTLLGQHLLTDFLLGRLRRSADLETILQVDP
jgi:hypothetical protein